MSSFILLLLHPINSAVSSMFIEDSIIMPSPFLLTFETLHTTSFIFKSYIRCYVLNNHYGIKNRRRKNCTKTAPKKSKKPRFNLSSAVSDIEKKHKTPKFKIQNVVATFNLGLDKLDLRELSLQKPFIEYNPHKFAAATLRLRNPKTTALAFASGNLVCTGSKDEITSRWASRRYVRLLQRHGVPVQFRKFKIQNIVASCNTGRPLKLKELGTKYGPYCSYEPDLFPGLVFAPQIQSLSFFASVREKLLSQAPKHVKRLKQHLSSCFKTYWSTFLTMTISQKVLLNTESKFVLKLYHLMPLI